MDGLYSKVITISLFRRSTKVHDKFSCSYLLFYIFSIDIDDSEMRHLANKIFSVVSNFEPLEIH